ncbi:terpene cyclase/mutase family protein [Streptomyces boncukensis]|uniref:Terpene cyclase/mutase family protein n=1 Tax=Streptomyces boncukensis TaxID=2711219 RepID=A0A6G4X6P0_9ACTN|nr:terpene cyclase/mutase family protein [Streptomyces boncukensis]NGO72414.1 terpene cyclase/mutase family protein [Streptomyces boncukensis]
MPHTRRALASIPATALTATVLLLPGTAQADAEADEDFTSPANAAATWMASQLTDDTHARGDHGLTADAVLALAATRTGGTVQKKATDWLAANSADYVNRGGAGRVFAGGAAKLALVAVVEGRDPAKFGGLNLTKTLRDRLQPSGRFTDNLPTGDGSNQFTQSLAVLALERAGKAPAKAVTFLAKSRCADGGYPLAFKSDPAKCKSHIDSTGLAVQALLSAGRTADAEPALEWLEDQQLKGGGFRDNSFGTPPANANSTALAVQALAAGGRIEAAGKGVGWLRTVQVGCDGAKADRGAVGYSKPKADGMALRATAQAVPALAGKSLADVDGKGSAPGLEPVTCEPGGGSSGTTSAGGTDSAGGSADGGTDGGADGGAASSVGGTFGGASGSGSSGTGGDTAGGDGSGGASSSTGTGGTDGTGGTGGGSATGGSGSSSSSGADGAATGGTSESLNSTGSDGGPSGGLAATGAAVLPAAGGAAALIAAGVTAVAVTRKRRAKTTA